MAILGSTTLTGCDSIPGFIAGGSRMIFNLSTAPTSWTKITDASYSNKMLRVIGGANGTALSPGGSLSFTSTFTTRGASPTQLSTQQSSANIQSISQANTISGNSSSEPFGYSVDNVTLSVPEMRAHTHPYQRGNYQALNLATAGTQGAPLGNPSVTNNANTSYTPPDSLPASSYQHTHGLSETPHSHGWSPISPGYQHNHPAPPSTVHHHTADVYTRDFSLTYVDIIVCEKQ